MSDPMSRRPVVASLGLMPLIAGTAVRAEGSVGIVETKKFTTTNFKLQGGAVLPEMTIAYETYGKLAADGRNAVLLTHGYTSSHHMRWPVLGPRPARTISSSRHSVPSNSTVEAPARRRFRAPVIRAQPGM